MPISAASFTREKQMGHLLLRSLVGLPLTGLVMGLVAQALKTGWLTSTFDDLTSAAVTGVIFGAVCAVGASVSTAVVIKVTGKYVRPYLGWFVHLVSTIVISWYLITDNGIETMAGMTLTVSVVVVSMPVSWWCLRPVRIAAGTED